MKASGSTALTRLIDVRLLRPHLTHEKLRASSYGFLQPLPVSDRNQAAPNCNSYRVRSILGSELFDQILDMEINGVSATAYICSGDISDYAIHRI